MVIATLNPSARGWVVLNDDGILYGPTWSMTSIGSWCQENAVELSGVGPPFEDLPASEKTEPRPDPVVMSTSETTEEMT